MGRESRKKRKARKWREANRHPSAEYLALKDERIAAEMRKAMGVPGYLGGLEYWIENNDWTNEKAKGLTEDEFRRFLEESMKTRYAPR